MTSTTTLDWTAQLSEQLEWHCHGQLRPRFEGLTDDEYLWKPAPWALSIAPRGKTARRRVGAGEWVVEWPDGPDDPGPRTIAWLVSHLVETFAERWEWTFGDHRARRDDRTEELT